MTKQPTPKVLIELRRQGLTTVDLARLFRLHPRAMATMLETKASKRRADN